ncbi:MarR family winged helix-turn-helix transcriptional regulator [Luteimonas sp. 3794]|uniref:MarR family winged helix-turn-helix transcriptional regulator n=1 Tax=Luteimonas sp. 3794 TaxID=2817730 RepID=UPI002854CE4D|nr:MarR family winged helix-turn-helix transcriptional regulator [Luteimonas sp. 3794]MDR6991799.1 DNA-binding MarR family transcriptional regulator [Luteimonas sp. 3794]
MTRPAVSEPAADHEGHAHRSLDLEQFLPYRLSVLTNRISRGLADIYSERFGISVTEWRVIAVLGRYPGLSANGVAERTAMDKVAVSRAVARLLERALIEREMHDSDRRRSVLELSEAGHAVYDVIVPLALEYQRSVLAPLDEAERATFAAMMAKLEAPLKE